MIEFLYYYHTFDFDDLLPIKDVVTSHFWTWRPFTQILIACTIVVLFLTQAYSFPGVVAVVWWIVHTKLLPKVHIFWAAVSVAGTIAPLLPTAVLAPIGWSVWWQKIIWMITVMIEEGMSMCSLDGSLFYRLVLVTNNQCTVHLLGDIIKAQMPFIPENNAT